MKRNFKLFRALRPVIHFLLAFILAVPALTGCTRNADDPDATGSPLPTDATETPQGYAQVQKPAATNEPTKAPIPDAIWDGSISAGFAGGKGTEDDPYLISNGAELAYLSQQVNSGASSFDGQYFKLSNDICLNDTANWESWKNGEEPANTWTAIGHLEYTQSAMETDTYDTVEYLFNGIFDGDGHTITGIYINKPESNDENYYQGLFGYVNNAIICNVGVEASYIHGYGSIGGIVGFFDFNTLDANCKLLNCWSGATVVGNNSVGGIVGYCVLTEIDNCRSFGDVSGENSVGGIAGDNRGDITNCYNSGKVSGQDFIGGIAGWNKEGDVIRCANAGSVTGKRSAGGVVGDNYRETVSDCYNVGTVSSEDLTGGIASTNCGSLINCYNAGKVIGKNSGGICGAHSYIEIMDFGYITNCYFLDSCGATVGINGDNSSLENTIKNVVALSDERMKDAKSFAGFDFDKVWTMNSGSNNGYPVLIGLSID